MNSIKVGTKITIEDLNYIIKKYESSNYETYYVVEGVYGGNLNGTYRSLAELTEELEFSIGRRVIRRALKGEQLNVKIVL